MHRCGKGLRPRSDSEWQILWITLVNIFFCVSSLGIEIMSNMLSLKSWIRFMNRGQYRCHPPGRCGRTGYTLDRYCILHHTANTRPLQPQPGTCQQKTNTEKKTPKKHCCAMQTWQYVAMCNMWTSFSFWTWGCF